MKAKGTVNIRLNVEQGVISTIKIYGDFLSSSGITSLEDKIVGCKYQLESIEQLLDDSNIQSVFGSAFTKQEVLSALIK